MARRTLQSRVNSAVQQHSVLDHTGEDGINLSILTKDVSELVNSLRYDLSNITVNLEQVSSKLEREQTDSVEANRRRDGERMLSNVTLSSIRDVMECCSKARNVINEIYTFSSTVHEEVYGLIASIKGLSSSIDLLVPLVSSVDASNRANQLRGLL